jgi:sporulation integral membrane protein YtvI
MFSALFGYIRAQLILMTVTFTQLSIGLWIIGIKNYILLALIISFVDALPVLGTGGIMVPWAAYSFITGNLKIGISLLILYAIVLVVRNLIEPKVLGEQIGMHPLLTLVAMYAGLQILGVAGLIIGPITVLTVKNIMSAILKKQSLKEYVDKRTSAH